MRWRDERSLTGLERACRCAPFVLPARLAITTSLATVFTVSGSSSRSRVSSEGQQL